MGIFSRKGSSGFSSSSTAEEVTQGIDGTALTAIVTGASSGIGAETARVLGLRGVHVIMGVRNVAAGTEIKEAIVKEIPSAKVDVMELDLSSMASVRKFASDFISRDLPLNLIINNAAAATPFMLSKDNIEMQFATNHLGHFLLINLLLDTMKKTAKESGKEGRIVIVSSDAHKFTYGEGIRFDKINDETGFSNFKAYGQSKLANILHANELARRFKVDFSANFSINVLILLCFSVGFYLQAIDEISLTYRLIDCAICFPRAHKQEEDVNITVNSIHPGTTVTNIFRHGGIFNGIVQTIGKFVFKSVQQGAATTCYVALHPQVQGMSGEYFSDCNLAKANDQARDIDLAKKLWDFSMNLVK
ncbi:hypothetical protein LWI29_003943 [Acer saccharum]|uniref:Short-chain dehydrogenase TIC 32, chloroplastic n=1 Tax=Acer saccharum TaxID=4024 RepID=A0AA39SQR5_ACESA|nr:hypothetical protein LWI29_003943 [Acer saccharum]KAK1584116.1 hypothetical protein Q3G72_029913 [Acer saccharum]